MKTCLILVTFGAFLGLLLLFGVISNYSVGSGKPFKRIRIFDVTGKLKVLNDSSGGIPGEDVVHTRPYDLYIANGFLVEDDEIRITLLTKCKYFANLILQTEISDDDNVDAFSISLELVEDCPSGWMPKCLYSGQYGTVKLPKDFNVEPYLRGESSFFISYEDSPMDAKPIRLLDSRVSKDKPKDHNLAVCVFPIVLMAEWTMLAQFFEQWIEHGATKFYFMYQSVSKEFDGMLRIYEHDRNISIERIDWSVLPIREGMSIEEDPNGQVMRAEEVFAVNDCVLRARKHVRYMAIFDFDETIVVYRENISLLELLNEKYGNGSSVGAFSFRSSYAQFENKWLNATNPKQLDFSMYNNVSLENRTLDHGSMSKIILIPERVKSQSVHFVLKMAKEEYKTHIFDPIESKLYHLRLVYWSHALPNSSPNYALQKYVVNWTKRYRKRIADEEQRLKTAQYEGYLTLTDEKWQSRGNAVMRELEQCHRKMFETRDKSCPAHYKCIDNLTTIHRDEWLFVDDSWVVL